MVGRSAAIIPLVLERERAKRDSRRSRAPRAVARRGPSACTRNRTSLRRRRSGRRVAVWGDGHRIRRGHAIRSACTAAGTSNVSGLESKLRIVSRNSAPAGTRTNGPGISGGLPGSEKASIAAAQRRPPPDSRSRADALGAAAMRDVRRRGEAEDESREADDRVPTGSSGPLLGSIQISHPTSLLVRVRSVAMTDAAERAIEHYSTRIGTVMSSGPRRLVGAWNGDIDISRRRIPVLSGVTSTS